MYLDPLAGCILTTLLLLQELDSLTNQKTIADMFDRLCDVDPYRRGYYHDMRKLPLTWEENHEAYFLLLQGLGFWWSVHLCWLFKMVSLHPPHDPWTCQERSEYNGGVHVYVTIFHAPFLLPLLSL